MPGDGPDLRRRMRDTLATDRLSVAPPTMADVDGIFEMVHGDAGRSVTDTLLWDGPDSRADIEQWVEKVGTNEFGDGGFHWVIRDRVGALAPAGQPIGAVSIRPVGSAGRCDTGYYVGAPYWGNGVMTEALTAVVAYAFDELDMHRIEATVFADNGASGRVLEKVGFTHEAVMRDAYRKRGRWVDAHLWRLLAPEWRR